MRSRRLAALAALLIAAFVPIIASATVTVSPTTSTNGSYTVSWTEFGDRLYLLESKDGAAATRTIVTGLSKAYTGKSPGSYGVHDQRKRRESPRYYRGLQLRAGH